MKQKQITPPVQSIYSAEDSETMNGPPAETERQEVPLFAKS